MDDPQGVEVLEALRVKDGITEWRRVDEEGRRESKGCGCGEG